MNRLWQIPFWIGLVCLGSSAAAQSETETQGDITMELSPKKIAVGTFYAGTTIHLKANIRTCDGAALVLESDDSEVTLNRKGRVAGIWLNVAQVTVSHAPAIYYLAKSGLLDQFTSSDLQKRFHLGLAFLRSATEFTSTKPLTGKEFGEFLKLKQNDRTYKLDLPVHLTAAGTDRQKLSATLPIPPTVPPGTYQVVLHTFRNGQHQESARAEVVIARMGLAAWMVALAHEHAAAYGFLAIAVAMVVGILMGLVFRSRSAH